VVSNLTVVSMRFRPRRELLVVLALAPSRAIRIQGIRAPEDDAEIDADEYLWEKLPGRCCFNGYLEDPEDEESEWIGSQVCNECNVWSEPDNFCHTSKEACEACGMRLFCPTTPPLVSGNKVCVGGSRVGEGCNDELGTGVCAAQGLGECQKACRENLQCEVFVYYSEEREGSCILCRDLAHTEPTPDAFTRIYATTPAPPPPSSPHQKVMHYTLLGGPKPPPPPHPSPAAPSPPPRPLAHLARSASTKEHFQCKFEDKTEYSVDADSGYTDRIATSKEECCNACGLHSGCHFFVFEPSSGTCVLLPQVGAEKLLNTPNEYTVSGSISIEVVTAASLRRGDCTFEEETGYSGGQLGPATALPGAPAITSPQGCCDACDKNPECAKFTYESFSKACIMFEAYSEKYLTAALSSGTVKGRTSQDIVAVGGTFSGRDAAPKPWLEQLSPPPAPPAFTIVLARPPPPPPPGDYAGTKSIMAGASIGVIGLMLGGFFMCAFCFFGPQLLDVLHTVTGGRYGKRHVGMQKLYTTDWDEQVALAATRPREKRRKKKGREQPKEGHVSVTVETAAMTQKKQLCVEEIGEYAELMDLVFDEFSSLLKGRSAREMLLFCYGESSQGRTGDESDDEARELRYAWLLVVGKSDLNQVLSSCSALKVTERAAGHTDEDFECAFLPDEEDIQSRRGKSKKVRKGKKQKKMVIIKDPHSDNPIEKTPEENLADALKAQEVVVAGDGSEEGEETEEDVEADEDNDEIRPVTLVGDGLRPLGDTVEAKYEETSDFPKLPLQAMKRGVRDGLGRIANGVSKGKRVEAEAEGNWSIQNVQEEAELHTHDHSSPENSDAELEDNCNQEDGVGSIGLSIVNPRRFTAARFNEDDGLSVIGAMHAAQRGQSFHRRDVGRGGLD